jgi:surface carbohydrate biosynthesis protein
MQSITKTIYIPVEEQNREMDAKLLLARSLANKGYTTIIGRHPTIIGNLPRFPPGLVLFKGVNAVPAFLMSRLERYRHICAATDEEALGLCKAEIMSRDMDPSVGPYCDMFFAQGPSHANALTKHIAGAGGKIETVGNMRLDLLRRPFRALYEAEAYELLERHGNYILINTNFGAINSRWGDRVAFRKILANVGILNPEDPVDMVYFDKLVKTEEDSIIVLRKVLDSLAASHPEINFIIRPHPSEKIEPWRRAYANRENFLVTVDGSHIPWMLGSRIMLHAGCTTGLESEVLDAPCLSLLPENHASLICSGLLSNVANATTVGTDAAIIVVSQILSGDLSYIHGTKIARSRDLRRHISALDGPYAYQRIAEAIATLVDKDRGRAGPPPWAPKEATTLLRTRAQLEQCRGSPIPDYLWAKFTIDVADVRKRLETLRVLTREHQMVDVEEIADGAFKISPR